jgi:hypothetical protein
MSTTTTTTTTTTIIEAHSRAIGFSQLALSFVAIGLLVYAELTDPNYTNVQGLLGDLRKSWMPVTSFIVFLFFVIVSVKVWTLV